MSDIGTLFEKLIGIMQKLRDPKDGCPWDLEQTHASIKPYLIEECYEVLDAIDAGPDKLCDELGDLLLQVVFHAQMASESGDFDIKGVIEAISQKLIRRHPHISFAGGKATLKVKDSTEVLKNWEERKQQELKGEQSILDGVPKRMPALLRAQRIGDKAARVGFEWDTLEAVRDKVFEELREFLEISADKDVPRERLLDEYGDILFSLSQLARRLGFDSEGLLNNGTDKFIRRFKAMEKLAPAPLKELSLDELDDLWEKVKADEPKG